MRLSGLGKANVALGVLGGIGCSLALLALAAENTGNATDEQTLNAYVGAYVLVASLMSIALIWGGLGLIRDRGWGRGVSAAGAGLMLLMVVGAHVWGLAAAEGFGGVGTGQDTAAATIASVLLQVGVTAYAVLMLTEVSRRRSGGEAG